MLCKIKVNEIINNELKKGNTVMGLGASTKGNMLLQTFDITKENRNVLKSLDPRTEGDKSIKTYIEPIDDFIYCIEPGELVILAAAPSMGKTSLALEIFKNQIINDQPAGFFSLEMGTVQLLNRMYAVESEV